MLLDSQRYYLKASLFYGNYAKMNKIYMRKKFNWEKKSKEYNNHLQNLYYCDRLKSKLRIVKRRKKIGNHFNESQLKNKILEFK